MTSSIPDSMSFDELQNLQTEAAERDAERLEEAIKATKTEGLYDGKTKDELIEIAEKHVQAAIEECNDPMVHKVMLFSMLENMIRWHTTVGVDVETEERATVCWLRDAGKFQAICNILGSISVGPNDFTLE